MTSRQNERGGLSPGARSLLVAARDADGPKPEDRERVRRALAVALAASAGTASVSASAVGGAKAIASATASTATTATTAGVGATSIASIAGTSILTKVAIAVVALGVGSSAIVAVNHYSSSGSAGRASDGDVAVSAPMASTQAAAMPRGEATMVIPAEIETAEIETPPVAEAPAEAAVLEPAVTEPVAVATHRARAMPRPEAEETPVSAELAALRGALTGTPEERLDAVDAHIARFPEGQMASTREQARRRAVSLLCAEGPDAVAHYLAGHPHSSSAALLRETCDSSR